MHSRSFIQLGVKNGRTVVSCNLGVVKGQQKVGLKRDLRVRWRE